LALPKFLPILATRIGTEKLARVEPVLRSRDGQDVWEGSRKLRIVRASGVPQRFLGRQFGKTQNLFHASVAVGRDDKDRSGKVGRASHTNDYVVVKLPLLPMIEQLVRSPAMTKGVE
jgi:hypothetical protein